MNMPWTVECRVEFQRQAKGRKRLQEAEARPLVTPGRTPHAARWLALALDCQQMLHEGRIRNYVELARLTNVTHARVCQILNLQFLAPDVQEAILFLPRTQSGRDRIILRDLQSIAAELDWKLQRRMWQRLCTASGIHDER